jgi:purine-binding chemotaxis protein CheW
MAEVTADARQVADRRVSELGGKYLTFGLAGEDYGLEILRVREIIGMMDITALPRTPDYMKGVINLRGKVIPVVDLRAKFGLETVEATEETCIIVVDVNGVAMGVVVDKVLEVLNIASNDIEPAPSFGVAVDTRFILGMGKAHANVTILLDISEVLTGREVQNLADVAEVADVAAVEPEAG